MESVCRHFLFVYFVSQCISALTLHQLDFFLEIFYGDLFLDKFLLICYMVLPMHMQLIRHPCMHAPTNGIQQPCDSAPSVFPTFNFQL